MNNFKRHEANIKARLVKILGSSSEHSLAINDIASYAAQTLSQFELTQTNLQNQRFLATATDENAILNKIKEISNNRVIRKAGTYGTGIVIVQADTVGIEIASGTQFISEDDYIYESRIAYTTQTITMPISSIERSGDITTVKVSSHGLSNDIEIEIYDTSSINTTFIGTFPITIVDGDYFTIENAGDDEIYTGSTLQAKFIGAKISVISQTQEDGVNKSYYDTLILGSNEDITGVFIGYSGITGGSSIETISTLQERGLSYINEQQFMSGSRAEQKYWIEQNTKSNFTYIYRTITSYNNIYFVISQFDKVNLTFTDFTTNELNAIKALFLENGNNGFHEAANTINFINPNFININIVIGGLLPATEDMKEQVRINLKAYINALPINNEIDLNAALSIDYLKLIVSDTYDSADNKATFSTMSVSGVDTITNKQDKPIVGTITFT